MTQILNVRPPSWFLFRFSRDRIKREPASNGLHVKKVEEYLRHAAECRDMARTAPPTHRPQLLQMAETWEGLAEARRQQMNKLATDSSET